MIASSSALSLNRTDSPLTDDDLTVGVDWPLGRLLVCVFSLAIFGAGFVRLFPPPPNQPPDFFAVGIAFSSLPLCPSAARSSSTIARISCFSATFSALAATRSSSNLLATA